MGFCPRRARAVFGDFLSTFLLLKVFPAFVLCFCVLLGSARAIRDRNTISREIVKTPPPWISGSHAIRFIFSLIPMPPQAFSGSRFLAVPGKPFSSTYPSGRPAKVGAVRFSIHLNPLTISQAETAVMLSSRTPPMLSRVFGRNP